MPNLISNEKDRIHWEYFLALEKDLVRLSRFISLEKRNKSVNSIELARLLLACSAECDTLFKSICHQLDNSFDKKKGSIDKYRRILNIHISNLASIDIRLRGHDWKNKPLKGFKNRTPAWWNANNSVKHNRTDNFHLASLENTISAMSALLLLNIVHYRLKGVDWITPTPEILLAPKLVSDDVSTYGIIAAIDSLTVSPKLINTSTNLRDSEDFI